MLHTLGSLYQYLDARFSEVASKTRFLKAYCEDADEVFHGVNLNRGRKSLKWFIYSIRKSISQEALQTLFVALISEAITKDKEMSLYENILTFESAKPYLFLASDRQFVLKREMKKIRFEEIGDWRAALYEGEEILTSFVFNEGIADILIFRNPSLCSAGVAFRTREGRDGGETGILDDFDIEKLFLELSKRNERWIIGKERNLLICGGFKRPENATSILLDELSHLVKAAWLSKQIKKSATNNAVNNE